MPAILGVQPVDAVIDATYLLGPQSLSEEVKLGVSCAVQVGERHAHEAIPLLWTVDGLRMRFDERHDNAGDTGRP